MNEQSEKKIIDFFKIDAKLIAFSIIVTILNFFSNKMQGNIIKTVWREILYIIIIFIFCYVLFLLLVKIKKLLFKVKLNTKNNYIVTVFKWLIFSIVVIISLSIFAVLSHPIYSFTANVGKIKIKQYIINRDSKYDKNINNVRGSYPENSIDYYPDYTYSSFGIGVSYSFKKNFSELLENTDIFEYFEWNIVENDWSNNIVRFSGKYNNNKYFDKSKILKNNIAYIEYQSLKRIFSENESRIINGNTNSLKWLFNRIENPEYIQNFNRNGLEYDMDNFLTLINDYYTKYYTNPDYVMTNSEYLILDSVYEKVKKSNSDLLYLFELLHEKNVPDFMDQFTELLYDSFYIPDYKTSEAYIDIEFEISDNKNCIIKSITISEKNKFRLKSDETIYIETNIPTSEITGESLFNEYYLNI
ncbi:hypothetical protein EW093_07575 [Thiospirochaeta perfilievii]|uniref:Uncharacterized protein n=1 Tax=Thiospirochaeta perfilievii TaxID=252967 RepID=A0A5C1QAR3_9SPIO|nr:hypothetical protein [Thiospirochaeta perfilievii]QEN04567.1 hypothetical protein EW093_07575 [Thiospirochaeta perfilievii]